MTAEEAVARVEGEPFVQLPDDLYIPPEALEVFLESFEGPLDLLLYLIRRHRLDISTISIEAVARQYMDYVELMRQARLDLAGEYLVMAATLAEMKSRALLPRPAPAAEEEEADPRADLIRRLQEYERFKEAAEALDRRPRAERDFHIARAAPSDDGQRPLPEASLSELLEAFRGALQRSRLHEEHHIGSQGLSVRERMSQILALLGDSSTVPGSGSGMTEAWVPGDSGSGAGMTEAGADHGRQSSSLRLEDLLDPSEGREGLAVTFLALLELAKAQLVELYQVAALTPLHIRKS